MIDYDRALLSPASVFRYPDEVVQEKSLSPRQKQEILYRWEHDAKLLQTAADENMAGSERANLALVQDALRKTERLNNESTWGVVFHDLAKTVLHWAGQSTALWIAVLVIAAWAVTGPLFRFSTAWQLTMYSATFLITFLMVFLIQRNQKRDSAAIHAKLDELVRATSGAKNGLHNHEALSEEKIETPRAAARAVAAKARKFLAAQGTGEDTSDQNRGGARMKQKGT